MGSPAQYDAWYDTDRGRWISDREFRLMMLMMQPEPGSSLLDVGCGTGHFSRRFFGSGLRVTGIDPDEAALEFARGRPGDIHYLPGDATRLPFDDQSFDYCAAVTSLCFVTEPEIALREMWRVSRRGVMLGLLNRDSRLYRERERHPGYAGARWDTLENVGDWISSADLSPAVIRCLTAVHYPGAGRFSRIMEKLLPASSRRGAFLAVYLSRRPEPAG